MTVQQLVVDKIDYYLSIVKYLRGREVFYKVVLDSGQNRDIISGELTEYQLKSYLLHFEQKLNNYCK